MTDSLGMGDALKRSSLIWLTISSAVGLTILITLGSWQLQRLEWKENLLAEIERISALPPIAISVVDEKALEIGAPRAVYAEGRYLSDKALRLVAQKQPESIISINPNAMGYHAYMPFLLSDGRMIFVNHGWLPNESAPTLKVPKSTIRLTGDLRRPSPPGFFIPENDPISNDWYWADLEAMGQTVNATLGTMHSAKNAYLILDRKAIPDAQKNEPPYPVPPAPKLSNNHLQYAFTWFSLGGCLVVIYMLMVFKSWRSRRTKSAKGRRA